MTLKTTFAVLAVGLAIASPSAAENAYQIIDDAKGQAEIRTPDGQPVFRYMYGRDTSTKESTFDTAKVFGHVVAPDGKTLTKGPGGLFPHHRGIFIGWNKLTHNGKSHDLWHVRNTAQLHQRFGENKAGAGGAAIEGLIDWIGTGGDPVISESRTYAISPAAGAYLQVDFTSRLTAVGGDVELNGDPEHAGVQFRPSQDVAENKSASYIFHADGIDPKRDRDLPWVAASFQVGDRWWTVQHMSHPENPTGARWSAYRDYGRFGPFVVMKIAADDSVTLRYRFRIIDGKAPAKESLAQAYTEYSHPQNK